MSEPRTVGPTTSTDHTNRTPDRTTRMSRHNGNITDDVPGVTPDSLETTMSAPQPPESNPPRVSDTSPPEPARAQKWAVPILVVGIIVSVIIIAGSMSSGSDSDQPAPQTQIEVAREACAAGVLADAGHTLVVDMAGEETGTGTATIDDIGCLLGILGAPTSVTSQMDKTRAMDGMQNATWDDLSATWTYHPDDGLDITITDN